MPQVEDGPVLKGPQGEDFYWKTKQGEGVHVHSQHQPWLALTMAIVHIVSWGGAIETWD